MRPAFTKPSEEVSRRMKRVRSRGTVLEGKMEAILSGAKIDYEVQPKLPGHPDFRVAGTKVLIFCDSSFWHGRRKAETTGISFKRNKKYWTDKIVRNRQRDRLTTDRLKTAGWIVLRLWDTSILKRPDEVAARILEAIQ